MSRLLNLLGSLKLTLEQWALITLAAIVGILAVLLRFKEQELCGTKVKLLESHFQNEQDRFDRQLDTAHSRVLSSKESYEKAVADYNASKRS